MENIETPEIVEDPSITSPVGSAVVSVLALVGAYKVGSLVARKTPWKIVRKSKVQETPVMTPVEN